MTARRRRPPHEQVESERRHNDFLYGLLHGPPDALDAAVRGIVAQIADAPELTHQDRNNTALCRRLRDAPEDVRRHTKLAFVFGMLCIFDQVRTWVGTQVPEPRLFENYVDRQLFPALDRLLYGRNMLADTDAAAERRPAPVREAAASGSLATSTDAARQLVVAADEMAPSTFVPVMTVRLFVATGVADYTLVCGTWRPPEKRPRKHAEQLRRNTEQLVR